MNRLFRHSLAALLALPALAAANTVTLNAVHDNTLYFSTAALSNGAGPNFFAGTNGVGMPLRGLLQFDLASTIPAGSTINSVQLALFMDRSNAPTVTVQVKRLLQAWGEGPSVAGSGGGGGGTAATGDATWNNAVHPTTAWTTPGGNFSSTVSASLAVSGVGAYTWASTPALVADAQSFLDAPTANFGWLLQVSNEAIQPSAKRFVSRENSQASRRPRLIVDFTPPPAVTPFCFGDGAGTPCPCANNGVTGRGCANSTSTLGAQLQTSGNASVAGDTLVLNGAGMPTATAIYFQGTAPQAGGSGVVFGDGLWCATGTLVRLAVKANVGGASTFPGTGDPSVSVQGLVTPGSTRHYQIWYADAATFCSSSTFNFSNGVSVTWN